MFQAAFTAAHYPFSAALLSLTQLFARSSFGVINVLMLCQNRINTIRDRHWSVCIRNAVFGLAQQQQEQQSWL